jgi:TusA-related sulfurtransferase
MVSVARTVDLTRSEDECGDTALQVVRRAYGQLAPGQVLEVRSTVAEHAFMVRAWARKTRRPIVADMADGGQTIIQLERTPDD